MPHSTIGIRSLVEHIRDPQTGDKVGYFGKEPGIPAIVPAGSLVVFSSLTFHRSGANTTDRMRRAYTTGPSTRREGTLLIEEENLATHAEQTVTRQGLSPSSLPDIGMSE